MNMEHLIRVSFSNSELSFSKKEILGGMGSSSSWLQRISEKVDLPVGFGCGDS